MNTLSFIELILIALAMGFDVFTVSMAVGSGRRAPRQSLRLSISFGFFQFFMPLMGWAIGISLFRNVEAFGHWIALFLLGGIGLHMIYEGLKTEDKKSDIDRSRGLSLLALAVATSIDSMGAGLTFGLLEMRILFPAIIIGLVAGAMAFAGIQLGRRFRSTLGHRMEIVGGIVLIGIGIRMFFAL